MNSRSLWVDYARGVGILLVVYGHVARGIMNAALPLSPNLFLAIDAVLYSFHMPLFFFLSGIFLVGSLRGKTWLEFMGGKISAIAYPYVVWSLLQGAVEVALASYTNGGVVWGDVFSLLWRPRAQFWFLYVLFLLFTIAGLIYQKSDKYWPEVWVGLGGAFFLIGGLGVESYAFVSLINWFVYFSLGAWVGRRCGTVNFLPSFFILLLSSLAFLLGVISLFWGWDSRIAEFLRALTGASFVVILALRLQKQSLPWLAQLGQLSLPIYLAHILTGSGVRIVLQKFFGISDPLIHLSLGMASGIVCPILLYVYAHRIGLALLFSPPQGVILSATAKKLG